METIIDKDLPEPQIRLRGMGIPRHLIIVTWCWVAVVSGLIATSETVFISQIHVFLALYCFSIILLRPFQEAPFTLLLLSVGPTDNFIFLGALLFFLRAILAGKLYIPKSAAGYIYLLLLVVTICSIFLSNMTVEFRPLQPILWSVTFCVPLTIAVANFRHQVDGRALASYGVMLIVLQIIPVFAAVPSYLSSGSPDVFGGTWVDADILGFWSTTLMVGSGLLALMNRWTSLEKRRLILLTIVGGVLAVLASGKIYSVFIISVGLLFLLFSNEFVQGVLRGKLKSVLISIAGFLLIGLVLSLVSGNLASIKSWAEYQYEHSHKILFLDRVFNKMENYGYSNLLGVGPGMLGSRAANAVSSDVLHKEEVHLPGFMTGSPSPEARILGGLFDKEFQESVRYMSANMVIPFSGIGAMKGEAGWIGLIVVVMLFLSLFWPASFRHMKGVNQEQLLVYVMASASGLSVIFLSVFDTGWEQPKVMVFLAMLMIARKVAPIYIQKELNDG